MFCFVVLFFFVFPGPFLPANAHFLHISYTLHVRVYFKCALAAILHSANAHLLYLLRVCTCFKCALAAISHTANVHLLHISHILHVCTYFKYTFAAMSHTPGVHLLHISYSARSHMLQMHTCWNIEYYITYSARSHMPQILYIMRVHCRKGREAS